MQHFMEKQLLGISDEWKQFTDEKISLVSPNPLIAEQKCVHPECIYTIHIQCNNDNIPFIKMPPILVGLW